MTLNLKSFKYGKRVSFRIMTDLFARWICDTDGEGQPQLAPLRGEFCLCLHGWVCSTRGSMLRHYLLKHDKNIYRAIFKTNYAKIKVLSYF